MYTSTSRNVMRIEFHAEILELNFNVRLWNMGKGQYERQH